MSTRRRFAVAAAAAALVAGGVTAFVALSDDDGRAPSGPPGGDETAEPGPLVATDFRLSPLRVGVAPGEPLEMRNDGDSQHTFTAIDGLFSTGVVEPGGRRSQTFDGPREIPIRCEIHPTMQAVIVVGS